MVQYVLVKSKKIVFIGDRQSLDLFRAFGAQVFPADTPSEAEKVLEELKDTGYAACYITEEVFSEQTMAAWMAERRLVVIPSLRSRTGKGHRMLEKMIRQATGMKDES